MFLTSSQVTVSMATGVCMLLSLWAGVCVASNLDTSFPLLKNGRDDSLFGLSVALHQDLKTDTYLLLVGAPTEKAGVNVPANRTGGVYSCPITAAQSDCSRIKLIDPGETIIFDTSNQVTKVWTTKHWYCYALWVIFWTFSRTVLISFVFVAVDPADLFCVMCHEGDIHGEVMCTMGISAAVTQTEIIVGTPGSHTWQGKTLLDSLMLLLQNSLHHLFFSNQPETMNHYRLTIASRLLSQDEETIVTGAPKDNKDDARGSVLLVAKHPKQLMVQQTLRGEQTGSYFGNAVATSDLNNDGWNDLLVGAPFYFQRQHEAGGAVYVYMNTGGRFDSAPSVVLRGPAGSAFGMAICAAGDLNQDGFQDFAVGAPFHESGSVMIWTGSKDGVSTEPSQVIWGNKVSSGFRTFGYSLSGGVDVDGNKYPDLLVGSLDNTVVRRANMLTDWLCVNISIQVKVCFTYMFSTGEKSDRDNITVNFTLTADVTSLKPRLRFKDGGLSVYSGFLSMPKEQCKTLEVDLLVRLKNIHSIHLSILRSIKQYIIFLYLCLCVSREKDSQMWNYNGSINRLILEVNVSNTASPGRLAEDAHYVSLSISIPRFLIYSGVRTKVLTLKVFPSEISLDTREIQSVLQLSTLSEQSDLVPVSVSMLVDYSLQTSLNLINPPGFTSFSGNVIGESAMKTTEDVGSLVLFTLQVHIKGKPLGHLGNLEVEFDWPMEVSNGKWLLYIAEIQVNGTSQPHCAPPGNIINSLNLKVTSETLASHWLTQSPCPYMHVGILSVQDCVHGAKCVKFTCPLGNMDNSATLTVRARLWNSTMIEVETILYSIVSPPAVQCGFFKRASTRELYQPKTQKAHMKSQPSEHERLDQEL
uniref:Integrin alpha third immunoglobulin-like domain-containing protein n=1 Tax=Labrus bergylta TaxID=56723 RepID=A0A3Q3GUM2_9LABR